MKIRGRVIILTILFSSFSTKSGRYLCFYGRLYHSVNNYGAFGTGCRSYCCVMLAYGVSTSAKDCWTTATPTRVPKSPVHYWICSWTFSWLSPIISPLEYFINNIIFYNCGMHLRPFVLLVGFVFLYTTPPVTITSSLCTLFSRVQTISHCYTSHDIIHTIYGDGLLPLSYLRAKTRDYLSFAYLFPVLFSLVSGGFVKCNAANLIPV